MSSTLMWRPPTIDARPLPRALKFALSRRLWGTDGSCGGGECGVSRNDLQYLEGLRDSGVDGAQELIDAIEKHGSVILWHEY